MVNNFLELEDFFENLNPELGEKSLNYFKNLMRDFSYENSLCKEDVLETKIFEVEGKLPF